MMSAVSCTVFQERRVSDRIKLIRQQWRHEINTYKGQHIQDFYEFIKIPQSISSLVSTIYLFNLYKKKFNFVLINFFELERTSICPTCPSLGTPLTPPIRLKHCFAEKSKLMKLFEKRHGCARDIIDDGEIRFLLSMYDAPKSEHSIENHKYLTLLNWIKQSTAVKFQFLPPTFSTAQQHFYRVYCQIRPQI